MEIDVNFVQVSSMGAMENGGNLPVQELALNKRKEVDTHAKRTRNGGFEIGQSVRLLL